MPLEIDRKELKRQAREDMKRVKPAFWVVTLVYLLMTTGVSLLCDFATGNFALFLSIAVTLYTWVVGFSYRLWALWTSRRWEPGLNSLFDGFSVAGRVIMLELGILTRTMGWTFLVSMGVSVLIIPMTGSSAGMMLVPVAVVGAVAAVQVIALRYSMAPYLLADYPGQGGGAAVVRSVWLTRGFIFEILKLYLSFAGWYLLSGVLSGAGLVVGAVFSGELSLLTGLPYDQLMGKLEAILSSPLSAALVFLFALPVTLFVTPYVEVTMAKLYGALISRPGFHPETGENEASM